MVIAEFCEHLAVRGYAHNTVRAKRSGLLMLAEWLAERSVTRPAEVTKPMLDAYQRSLYYRRKKNGKPLTFATQSERLIAVRMLYRWLVRGNRMLHDPAAAIELPRTEQRLPRAVLSAGEAERVLAVPDVGCPLGLRDRAMLELLYATGIRRAELAALAVFDLDVERATLSVRQGKGRRDRMVPTGERAAAWCERYLEAARPRLAVEPDEGVLFLTAEGGKIGLQRLTRLMGSYLERSGVGKPGACHIFRHTMATVMLEGGADIRYVQQMLGHASITSTQIYTRVSMRELAAVHASTHPGASKESRSRDGEEARSPEGAHRDSTTQQSAGLAAEALSEELGAEAAAERADLS